MIFLLGGYDLEMHTIKELLELKNIAYIDKQLSWGAKLSAYAEELHNDKDVFYGIELEEDIPPPKNYHHIDHHNKNMHKLSSLEQVAKIIDVKLTRHQMLVAKNDSRYIRGMQSIGATSKEIADIRALDRELQGVTKEDETLAQDAIKQSNHSNILFSKTNKFSAISDRIYDKFDQYILYNEVTVSFYGYKLSKVIEVLRQQKIKEVDYYYGGGDEGFVGLKDNKVTKEGIQKLIQKVVQYV